MEIVRHFCDRCGIAIKEDDGALDLALDDFCENKTRVDLCNGCFEELKEKICVFVRDDVMGEKEE